MGSLQKKFYIYLLTLFLLPMHLMAICWTGYNIEFKAYAFIPTSCCAQNIYSSCMANYELEIGKTFCCNWQGWVNGGYISSEGHRHFAGHKARLNLVPVTLGLKYVYHWCPGIDLFAGVGPAFSFIRTNAFARSSHSYHSKSTVGGTAKVGLLYQLNDNLYANFSADYIYQRFDLSNRFDGTSCHCKADLSGIKLGGGFGFIF